jgi:hypothetical protein
LIKDASHATRTNGSPEVVWSDDGISDAGHEGHALHSGTYPCGPPSPPADVPEVRLSILLTVTGVITGAAVIFIQRRRRLAAIR